MRHEWTRMIANRAPMSADDHEWGVDVYGAWLGFSGEGN